MSLRRIVSLSLMLSVVTMLTTSIILYIVPQGRVAYWAEWKLLGISKSQWGSLHTNLGLFMLVAAFFHIFFNWRPMTTYMKNKAREFRVVTPNFNVAFAVVAVFIALTLAELPPMVWIQGLRGSIEKDLARKLGEPPYGHAEESGLNTFLRNVNLDKAQALAHLRAARIVVVDPTTTILDIAKAHDMTPQELYEIMRGPEDSRSTGAKSIPARRPRGTGRKTLEVFCVEYNRDLDEAVRFLTAEGLTIDPTAKLKDIAAANDVQVLHLLDILRKGFGE